jgi:hypothetical protein
MAVHLLWIGSAGSPLARAAAISFDPEPETRIGAAGIAERSLADEIAGQM